MVIHPHSFMDPGGYAGNRGAGRKRGRLPTRLATLLLAVLYLGLALFPVQDTRGWRR